MGRLFSFNRRRKKIKNPRKQVGRIAQVTSIESTDEVQFIRNSPSYDGKYLISKDSKHILSSQSSTPLFWVTSDLQDSSLVDLINRLPTSPDNFTNLVDAITWCKENGFLIIKDGESNQITTENLTYEIDFSKVLSYPKGGNKIFNIVGGSGDLNNHALSEWVCMASNSTTALYAAPYAGTYIYEIDQNGNQTTKVSNVGPTNGSFTCAEGRRYYSNKPIHLHRNGENHLFCPISLKGTQFGHYSNRYNGSTYKIYAPHGANVRQFAGTNPLTGTAYATLNLGAGELGTMTYSNDNVNNYFLSDRPIIMVVYEDGGGDKSILPPADNLVYQRRNSGEAMMNNSAPDNTNGGYVLSGSYACWAIAIADGSGGDMTTHISANHITENYTWGSTVSDYQIVAPYPNTEIVVSSWNGSSWTAHETQSLNGTELNPAMSFRSGNAGFGVQDSISNDSGGANNFNGNTLWKWEGNNPFAIWINDSSNDEEKLLGWNDGWETDNGVLYNSPAYNNGGWIAMDGVDDYIQAASIISPSTGSFSVEIIYKLTAQGRGGLFERNQGSPYNGWSLGQGGTSIWAFTVSDNYSNGTIQADYTYPTSNIWYHDIATFNGSNNVKGYRNGELVDSTTGITVGNLDTGGTRQPLRIFYRDAGSSPLRGDFAKARIYNKELSESEIKQNYYGGPIVTNGLIFAVDGSNLVSYENGSATAYSLTGSNDGTLTNGVSFSDENGGVLYFDGSNDYIEFTDNYIGTELAISSAQDYTLEAWIKVETSSGTTTSAATIVGQTSSTGYGFQVGESGGKPRMNYGARSTSNFYSSTFEYNEWIHVTLVKLPNAGCRSFLNGELDVTYGSDLRISSPSDGALRLGNASSRVTGYYDGAIGPVRIYNRALTDDEVLQNFNAQKSRFGL